MKTYEALIQYSNIVEIEIINSHNSPKMHYVGIIYVMHYPLITKTWDFTKREVRRGSWRGEEWKKIYLLKIDKRDELNRMDEPNLTQVGSLGWGKACLCPAHPQSGPEVWSSHSVVWCNKKEEDLTDRLCKHLRSSHSVVWCTKNLEEVDFTDCRW